MFQYITEAVIFSKGAPYRRSIFSNYLFMFMLVFVTFFGLFVALIPNQNIVDFFSIRIIPDMKYRFTLILISMIHFFISFMFESYIVDPDFLVNYDIKDQSQRQLKDDDRQKKCYPKRTSNLMPYHKIEIEIRKDTQWPPITHEPNSIPVTEENQSENNNVVPNIDKEKTRANEILAQIDNYNRETKRGKNHDDQNLETSF